MNQYIFTFLLIIVTFQTKIYNFSQSESILIKIKVETISDKKA